MAESATVIVVNEKTKLTQEVPRVYLDIYPDLRELSPASVTERQRGKEKKMFGEYITPAHKPKAVAKPTEAEKEGGK